VSERSRATKSWADRVMALVWSSARSLLLDGFAGYAAGIYPAGPQNSPHRPDSAIAPPGRDVTTAITMESNMNKTITLLASGAITGLMLTAAEPPLPPRVNFVATPASQLHLGMTADDVIHVMGKAARDTDLTVGSAHMRKLEFTDAIPSQVILSDGKVSRVTLDAFRMEKDSSPSFIRPAWPGSASSAVRRVLGEPAAVIHHTFFGIEVGQWIYARAGGGGASVFLRADRVITKSVGGEAPADLFRVNLPTPRQAESEGPMREPRVGMRERDIWELHGVPSFRVDYVRNGEQASRKSTRPEATRPSSPSPSSMEC
jgi:hypothetical protein